MHSCCLWLRRKASRCNALVQNMFSIVHFNMAPDYNLEVAWHMRIIKLRYESSTLILYKELSSPIFQSLSVSQWVIELGIRDTWPDLHFVQYIKAIFIPDICHFFTRAKFLENKIYTEKRQFFALNL